MSAITTLPADFPQSPDQLAACADHKLTVEIAEAELRELHAQIVAAIEAAEAARDTIARLAGPSPSFLPAHLKTMMDIGAGYSRHCKATLEALFRLRNSPKPEPQSRQPEYCWKGQ